jgi:hypothetical protein
MKNFCETLTSNFVLRCAVRSAYYSLAFSVGEAISWYFSGVGGCFLLSIEERKGQAGKKNYSLFLPNSLMLAV